MSRSFVAAFSAICLTFATAVSGALADELDTARETARVVREQFVLPDIGEITANEIQKRWEAGAYADLEKAELAERLSADLLEISGDNHIRVLFDPERVARIRRRNSDKGEESAEDRKKREQDEAENALESRLDNYGLKGVHVLPGSVGYIRFDYFDGDIDASSEMIGTAMSLLEASDAIIFDLRYNVGGSIRAIPFILGYFLGPDAVQYGVFHEPWKDISKPEFSNPDVPGARHYAKPLYLLTSGTTFSAAEDISYNLQALGRATIVGEQSYGGGAAWYAEILSDEFFMRIPRTRSVNFVTGTYFEEGEGVAPDVAVPAMQAFDTAYLAALDQLIADAVDDTRRSTLDWARRIVAARLDQPHLEPGTLNRFAGNYGTIRIRADSGVLQMSLRERSFVELTPLSANMFYDDRSTAFQFKFIEEDGEVTGMSVLTPDGQVGTREKEANQ